MTKGLDKFFDLPSIDEILAETEEEGLEPVEQEDEEIISAPPVVKERVGELISHEDLKADDHSKSMDSIHDEMIQHARDMTELAFDLDPARAPRMLEVAGSYYKSAMDAKISKRDAQLKLMKLIQDQQKIDLEAAKTRHMLGNDTSDKADVIMVEDRNTLLRRLADEAIKKS